MTMLLRALCVLSTFVVAFAISMTGECCGHEEQWAACNEDTLCPVCKPRDCRFKDWSDWTYMGGCFGLCSRQRGYKEVNNECGDPCNGTKSETKNCTDDPFFQSTCNKKDIDCDLSEWKEWSTCRSKEDQAYRQRAVLVHAKFKGEACGSNGSASIQETKTCHSPDLSNQRDCQFSDWSKWTSCTATCDGGHQSRSRRVTKEADTGAKGCNGTLLETQQCSTQTCLKTHDCTFSSWSKWSECSCSANGGHVDGPCHRFKTRTITQPATGSGSACVGDTKLSEGCAKQSIEPKDCQFGNWLKWSDCSATCGGGQRVRFKHLHARALHGGNCPKTVTQQTEGCNTDKCPHSCAYSDWADWTNCDHTCGTGLQTRNRTVTGDDCNGELKVVRGCDNKCPAVDCKWSQWSHWSGCNAKCGGGTRTRSRKVSTLSKYGGNPCDANANVSIEPCNNMSCADICSNGTWSNWADWSPCSAITPDSVDDSPCSTIVEAGYTSRNRQVKFYPNYCGFPVVGNTSEVKVCKSPSPGKPQDCKISDWEDWSQCSASCFGMTYRARRIVHPANSPKQKSCKNQSLKEYKTCNPSEGEDEDSDCPAVPNRDCAMEEWSDWSKCSASCGIGRIERTRGIKRNVVGAGAKCDEDMKQSKECHQSKCVQPKCVDCEWTDWREWSKCTGCNGQRTRNRSVATDANFCGKPCSKGTSVASKETESCKGECDVTGYCVWTSWSVGSCHFQDSTSCGAKTRLNKRQAKYSASPPKKGGFLAEGTPSTCKVVSESLLEACPGEFKVCQHAGKKDCKFLDWSDWDTPSCGKYAGLCQRHRNYTKPEHGGEVCETGHLTETKPCRADCDKSVDCKFSDWKPWSKCSSTHTQSVRSRTIDTAPVLPGEICKGSLREMKSCEKYGASSPKDCVVSPWKDWGECSKSCAGGLQSRHRTIEPSRGGGKPCGEALEETQACGDTPCPPKGKKKGCVFDEWEVTLKRGTSATALQRIRTRGFTSPVNGGDACHGPLEQLVPPEPQDCELSDWKDWDECDSNCENGQKYRTRSVKQQDMFGGKKCPQPMQLREVQPCKGNLKLCDEPGLTKLNDWSSWSACDVTCGNGQQYRSRKIKTPGLAFKANFTSLNETRTCEVKKSCVEDCQWYDWEEWTDCTKSCDGGQKQRNRKIKHVPESKGHSCAANPMREVVSCHEDPCHPPHCVDGKWGKWSKWGDCSASCMGGVMIRVRNSTASNHCGKALKGPNHEIKGCNTKQCKDADCKFSDWSKWSDCDATCDGKQARNRTIKDPGSGNGEYCHGGLNEIRTCNAAVDNDKCPVRLPIDCKYSKWETSECSSTCSNHQGHQTRSRKPIQEAKYGGAACNKTVKEIVPCKGNKSCPVPKPSDCKWAEWSDWSACNKCENGQKKQTRNIQQGPRNGGKACENKTVEKIEACNNTALCADTRCDWTDWAPWSKCTRTCKGGKKMRKRILKLSKRSQADVDEVVKRERLFSTYQELRQHLDDARNQRWQDFSIAFCGGGLAFFLGAVVLRKVRQRIYFQHVPVMPVTYRPVSREVVD